MDFKVDMSELSKQHREELLKTPHSLKLEVVMPPVDMFSMLKGEGFMPSVLRESNNGCNSMTIAMLLFTLDNVIKVELEDEDVSKSYKLINAMMRCKDCGSTEYKKEDKDE